MRYRFVSFAIDRPVATSMFFLALCLLGIFSWQRIPIELLPVLTGQKLFVQFYRPGSDPEVVEREILMPLEARASELPGVKRTWAEIRGSEGSFGIEFNSHTNYQVRDLELRSIAARIGRDQPPGSRVVVNSEDSTVLSRFVMTVQVTGHGDINELRDLVEEQIQPRMAAVSGVSRVFISGGAPQQATVWLDMQRCAEFGIEKAQVIEALSGAVQPLRFLGNAQSNQLGDYQQLAVVSNGRPDGLRTLGETRIVANKPVLLRHVADIRMSTREATSIFRINGKPSVGIIVFQNEGDNLVQLGRGVRERLDELREELEPLGIELIMGFDASKLVEDQLSRLQKLGLSGFLIALVILYLFLSEVRAVFVVAIAVPVSLLIAGALLYLCGYTLNLLTVSGLAVGVGMLVDNSIVVYEAIQRSLERGLHPSHAAIQGIRRTIRAIIAASAASAVVLLPGLFLIDDVFMRQILQVVAAAILLPSLASLLVALLLVPLLAQWLAAPAAMSRTQRAREQRREHGDRNRPQLAHDMFLALLKVFLRRPLPGVVGIFVLVAVTITLLLPWVLADSDNEAGSNPDQVRIDVEFDSGSTLQAAGVVFSRFESAVKDLEGVTRVESSYRETEGTLTVYLDQDEFPRTPAARVRSAVTDAAEGLRGVRLRSVSVAGNDNRGGPGGDRQGQLFGNAPSFVSISGPDMGKLHQLALEVRERLLSIPQIESVHLSSRDGRAEIQLAPSPLALDAYGLYPGQALSVLGAAGREGLVLPIGLMTRDGREIPIALRQAQSQKLNLVSVLEQLPVTTEKGSLPLGEFANGRVTLPSPAIVHRNGRRETGLEYRVKAEAATVGPQRVELENAIQAAIRGAYRPPGYVIEAIGSDQNTQWGKRVLLPILLLLFALLAITFESLTMPALVLLAVPLSVLGAVWASLIAGTGADVMALVGVVVLLGLTVNPAILLVDRMQQRIVVGGASGGSAALAAVRERVRPVLMTSSTTVAGLVPLALSSGSEIEMWPPFATVVMGGLITSTLLTLLVIPVGFVALSTLDRVFGRLGPWGVLAWLGLTAAIVTPLITSGQIVTFHFQLLTVLMVAGATLWMIARVFGRLDETELSRDAMTIETRHLSKIYGRAGPIGQAWRRSQRFAEKFPLLSARDSRQRSVVFALLSAASLYLAVNLQTFFWKIVFYYVAAMAFGRLVIELRRSRRSLEPAGRFESRVTRAMPWIALGGLMTVYTLMPMLKDQSVRLQPVGILLLGLGTLIIQSGRNHARKIASGAVEELSSDSKLWRARSAWRAVCMSLFGMGLQRQEFTALVSVNLAASHGMIGILGPNGAGKTTLLRILSGVLEPSVGTVHYGGRERRTFGRQLPGLIGYLPQSFGLPSHLTAREYLEYFALAYQIGDRETRERRVTHLLAEVGLEQRQHERIQEFSGGMRQRVAIARTLLREPPIVIVDEPTVGLDPRERIRLRNLLTQLSAGRIVLFSTHVVEDVAVSCERVIVMKRGAVVYDGRPEELARLAASKVWGLRLLASDAATFARGHKVIDQVPEPGDIVRLRVLARERPHVDAEPLEAGLEDGYFELFNRAAAS